MDFNESFTLSNVYVGQSNSPSEMQELYACRVCLATDIKLFDIHECDLAQSFEAVMGTAVPPDDGMPQHLCHYCFALLQKYAAFREKFARANIILQTAAMLNHNVITTDFIRMIDREAEELSLPLCYQSTGFIDYEIIEEAADEDEMQAVFEDMEVVVPENADMEDTKVKIKQETLDYCEEDHKEKDIKPILKPSKKQSVVGSQNVDLNKITFVKDVKIEEVNPASSAPHPHPNIWVVTLTPQQQVDEVEARRTSPAFFNALYKCDRCYRGFFASQAFRRHMMLHSTSEGPYECNVCQIRVITEAKLRVHIASEHEKRFICLICDHRTNNNHRALRHQKIHDGSVFECAHCAQVFKKSSLLERHIRLVHGQLVCEVCGEMFNSQLALKKHGLSVHNAQLSTETWLRCSSCSTEFKGVEAFNKHLATAGRHNKSHAGLDHYCKHCGESFENEVALKDHQIIHVSEDGRFHCPECNTDFPSFSRLTRHFESSHAELVETCDIVEEPPEGESGGEGEGEGQEEDEEGEGEVVVQKSKKRKRAVKTLYLRSDSSEKPYLCNYCTKTFKFPQYLQIHIRTHTGERPYVCNMCSMSFQAKANLNRHLKVHTGEKPYVCEICSKAFTQSNSMKVHVKTVHLMMPDPYKDRRKFYKRKNRANTYNSIKVHTGEKPYVCEICGKAFTQSNSMKVHVKTVHLKMPDPYKDRRKFYKHKNRANTYNSIKVTSE